MFAGQCASPFGMKWDILFYSCVDILLKQLKKVVNCRVFHMQPMASWVKKEGGAESCNFLMRTSNF